MEIVVKITVKGALKFMNPLGSLPGASSDQFSLNWMDILKVVRMLAVQGASLFITMWAPSLMGMNYFWHGQDFTPYVLIAVSAGVEMARRFVSGNSPAPEPVQPPAAGV
jgi:hypothetical protein